MPGLSIAVTGGSGFIGSHLVDALVDAGHRLTVIDTRAPQRPDITFVAADITDLDALTVALIGHDVVFHLAAVSNINVAFAAPIDTVELNTVGTTCVWEAARRSGVGRAVLASTVWVYAGAHGPGPFDEDTPFHLPGAGHIYTTSKIAAEMIVHNYAELYGQHFTILRYGIPYGTRMRPELVIPRFVHQCLAGRPITVNGDGSQFRNYVWIGDLIDGHLRALAPVAEDQVINLEGPTRISVRDIADTVTSIIGGPTEVTYVPTRVGDYAGKDVSAAKAHRLLGWRADTPFADGMSTYIESCRAGHEPVPVDAP